MPACSHPLLRKQQAAETSPWLLRCREAGATPVRLLCGSCRPHTFPGCLSSPKRSQRTAKEWRGWAHQGTLHGPSWVQTPAGGPAVNTFYREGNRGRQEARQSHTMVRGGHRSVVTLSSHTSTPPDHKEHSASPVERTEATRSKSWLCNIVALCPWGTHFASLSP